MWLDINANHVCLLVCRKCLSVDDILQHILEIAIRLNELPRIHDIYPLARP